MKTTIRKQNDVPFVEGNSPVLNARPHMNAVKSVRRLGYLLLFTGLAAISTSCGVGWISAEPSYGIEIERPARPGVGYVWINGGWRWDYHSHNYVREPGYWSSPRAHHSYRDGYWRSGPRGKAWVRGHWERGHDRDDRR
jgi:hypothetical protein